mgnify:CR=1 FL=1
MLPPSGDQFEISAGGYRAVVVESGDPDKNRQFVERLGARLEAWREKQTGSVAEAPE